MPVSVRRRRRTAVRLPSTAAGRFRRYTAHGLSVRAASRRGALGVSLEHSGQASDHPTPPASLCPGCQAGRAAASGRWVGAGKRGGTRAWHTRLSTRQSATAASLAACLYPEAASEISRSCACRLRDSGTQAGEHDVLLSAARGAAALCPRAATCPRAAAASAGPSGTVRPEPAARLHTHIGSVGRMNVCLHAIVKHLTGLEQRHKPQLIQY